jgi:hypothetical protein
VSIADIHEVHLSGSKKIRLFYNWVPDKAHSGYQLLVKLLVYTNYEYQQYWNLLAFTTLFVVCRGTFKYVHSISFATGWAQ